MVIMFTVPVQLKKKITDLMMVRCRKLIVTLLSILTFNQLKLTLISYNFFFSHNIVTFSLPYGYCLLELKTYS